MKIIISNEIETDYRFSSGEDDPRKMYLEDLKQELEIIKKKRMSIYETDVQNIVLGKVYNILNEEIEKKEKNPSLKNNFLCEIVDELDDWLEDKGIKVPNEERDKEDPENTTNFYGEDFDEIMEMMREICRKNGIVVEDEWED